MSEISSAAVVLAAGRGNRFGRLKQFETIDGRTMVDWVIDTAAAACDCVVLVLPTDHGPDEGDLPPVWNGRTVHAVTRGGLSHGESALAGFRRVPDDIDAVVFASASHPLAGLDLYRRTIDAVAAGAAAAAPLNPIADAVKQHADGVVTRTIDKADLVTVQAPCAFRRAVLAEAYQAFGGRGQRPLPPEELEMVERLGGRIVLVEGEPTNIHVTTPQHLAIARRLAGLVPAATPSPTPSQ